MECEMGFDALRALLSFSQPSQEDRTKFAGSFVDKALSHFHIFRCGL